MRKSEIDNAYGVCWKRTATFMKLCRHKTMNGHLPGCHSEYFTALIAEFRKEELEILTAIRNVEKGGDWEKKRETYKIYRFSKYEYDQRLRNTIDRVKKKIELGI